MNTHPIEDAPILGHYINGQRDSGGDLTSPIINPATGNKDRDVSLASAQTVDCAIAAAKAAFPAWRDMRPAKRAQIMFRYKQLLEQNIDRISRVISREHGKIIDDAKGEFLRGVEIVEYACGAPEFLKGEHVKNVGPSIDSWSEHHPLGVVAGITPFNFPAMVPMWMFPYGHCLRELLYP